MYPTHHVQVLDLKFPCPIPPSSCWLGISSGADSFDTSLSTNTLKVACGKYRKTKPVLWLPSVEACSGRTPLQGQTFKKKIKFADYNNLGKTQSIGKDAAPAQTASVDGGVAKEDSHKTVVRRRALSILDYPPPRDCWTESSQSPSIQLKRRCRRSHVHRLR